MIESDSTRSKRREKKGGGMAGARKNVETEVIVQGRESSTEERENPLRFVRLSSAAVVWPCERAEGFWRGLGGKMHGFWSLKGFKTSSGLPANALSLLNMQEF